MDDAPVHSVPVTCAVLQGTRPGGALCDLQSSLRDYEERLRLAEEAANIGHYRIDVDAGTAEWSDQTFRIFGLSPSDGAPTAESYASMVHPDDRAMVYAHFGQCLSEKKRFDLTYRILRADGRVRVVHSIGTLRTSSRTGSTVMSGTFQDVTEPHEALEALRTSERRMRSLVESSDDHVFMLDPEGTFIASNDRVQHYGLTSGSELLGRTMAELCPPQTASLHSLYLRQIRESGTAVAFEHSLDGENGITFHRHVLNPIMENGRLLAIGGICRDITDQKRLEKDLRESRALLLDRNRELERKNVALKELIQHLRDPAGSKAPPVPEAQVREGTPIPRELSTLTPRELQVCLQLRKGLSSKEVAHRLGIAPRSVETHRNHIRRKLRLDGENLSAYLQMLLGRPSD